MKIPLQATLIEELERCAISCEIARGFSLLEEIFADGEEILIDQELVAPFLLNLAEWVDLGYRDIAFFQRVGQHVDALVDVHTSVLDFLRIKLAIAFSLLATEQADLAVELLDLVLHAGNSLISPHILFLTYHWKARAHRKRGDYQLASDLITAARAAAAAMNAPRLVALTKIQESWLIFQNGDRKAAYKLLDEAEAALRSTGHALSLGNIESARGRFIRRVGEYERALLHFERAIELYSARHPRHPNLARALVNAAYVKRLMALDIQSETKGGQLPGTIHARYLKISREALDLLRRAEDIYAYHHHQGGIGAVLVNAGHLHLESGDIDAAYENGMRAYDLGCERHDIILTARARNLQCAVELARSEEQLGDDSYMRAQLAIQYAEEAIALATQTQNKRLIAEAYLARGSAAADEQFQDWDTAREYAAKAAALLTRDDRDHLYKELGHLKARLMRSDGIDQRLKLWSEGHFGDKTFQQIQEDFAELVIPKIWANLGHSVSRVAHKHSVSPKKVRRILQNVGLTMPQHSDQLPRLTSEEHRRKPGSGRRQSSQAPRCAST